MPDKEKFISEEKYIYIVFGNIIMMGYRSLFVTVHSLDWLKNMAAFKLPKQFHDLPKVNPIYILGPRCRQSI